MNAVEMLTKARGLISQEEKWTQGAFARDHKGEAVNEYETGAVQFCALGALNRIEYDTRAEDPAVSVAVKSLRAAISGRRLMTFNDDFQTAHADVMAAFDRAIALAEEEDACTSYRLWGAY